MIALKDTWKFKTVAKGQGISQKWFSPEVSDRSWATVRSGKGYGWEKQGFEGYTGYAWYRQTLRVPGEAGGKKHLILLFHAVDEDGVGANQKRASVRDQQPVNKNLE